MNPAGGWLAAAAVALALHAGTAAAVDGAAPSPTRPEVISLSDLRGTIKRRGGKPLVLHVWASWCQPCVHELPLVGTLLRDARARGLDVYSVSLDKPDERSTERMIRVLRGGDQINLTILRMDDPDKVLAQVDPEWEGDIPAFFAYDRSGKLRRAHVGEMTRDKFERLVSGLVLPVKK
jgi:cytochrome c biogenesis protein CcmG/thiol:disulfide interchange protein DsbE